MKLKGIAAAEYQLPDIYKAKNKETDTSEILNLYESMVDQEYTFKDAKAFLDNEAAFKKLNYGQRLNCARAYAAELCKNLNIRTPEVYFAEYKKIKGNKYDGTFWHGAEIITLNYLADANHIKLDLAHEIKHYHQYLIKEKGYKPATTPSEETLKDWDNDGAYPYWVSPLEIDAEKYAQDICAKKFSYFRAHTTQKRQLDERLAEKEAIEKRYGKGDSAITTFE